MERFPAYTYTGLMNEDPEFLRMLVIEARGTAHEESATEEG